MTDRYQTLAAGLSSPAVGAFLVTPNDATDLPEVTRALIVGPGAVQVTTKDGATLVLPDMGGNWQWDLRVSRVLATGTTATLVVGLY
ncbi:MAG TPA: hypothetical protein VL418_05140 [Devosiaceae bacterium]|nr:hypothetical protein [Devosiaceae bacterium]